MPSINGTAQFASDRRGKPLDPDLVQDVIRRLRDSEGDRAISREMGLSRITVRKYRELAAGAGLTDTGAAPPDPEAVAAIRPRGPAGPPRRVSNLEAYQAAVEGWWDAGLGMMAIFRRLRSEHSFTGSYGSVRRFIHRYQATGPTQRKPVAARQRADHKPGNDEGWAERGHYWERTAPRPGRRSGRRSRMAMRRPLVLTGYGVHLRVDKGTLLMRDGFSYHPQAGRELRLFPGDPQMPSRIVLVDSHGSLSLEVISWLATQQVPLLLLNWRGETISVVGTTAASFPELRDVQLAARANGVGLVVATWLVQEKIRASRSTLTTFPESPGRELAMHKLDESLRQLRWSPATIEAVRLLEAQAALAYFTFWQSLPLRWKGKWQRPIPPAWERVGYRSNESGTNRHATHPVNAMLNYAYGVLESQVRTVAVAAGLDPAIGYLHACRPGRDALVYDLMEPFRPRVDRLVLGFICSHVFAPGDIIQAANGVCRLHPQLAKQVVGMTVADDIVQETVAEVAVQLGTLTPITTAAGPALLDERAACHQSSSRIPSSIPRTRSPEGTSSSPRTASPTRSSRRAALAPTSCPFPARRTSVKSANSP